MIAQGRRLIESEGEIDMVIAQPGSRTSTVPPPLPDAADLSISDADWRVLEHEVATYVAALSTELASMARAAKMDLLAYFLEMAQVEATAQAERSEGASAG